MGKTATQGTLSPFAFGPGLPIYEADVQTVAENLNYVAGESPTVYFSLICGTHAWGSAGSIATHNVVLSSSAGAVTYYEGHVWIDPDEQQISVAAAFNNLVAPNTIDVTWTLGLASQVVSYTSADEDVEKSHTFATSSTGTGWRSFKVQINHTAGSAANIELHSIRMEAEPIAATDLPEPSD